MTILTCGPDGSPAVLQTNCLGVLRVRAEHVPDVARKLRRAADALEAAVAEVSG